MTRWRRIQRRHQAEAGEHDQGQGKADLIERSIPKRFKEEWQQLIQEVLGQDDVIVALTKDHQVRAQPQGKKQEQQNQPGRHRPAVAPAQKPIGDQQQGNITEISAVAAGLTILFEPFAQF